jgi:outer membrane protein OmpA-like peptidoglycan-associated protein
MKKWIFLLFSVTLLAAQGPANAQLLKRIKNEVRSRVENHVVNGSGNAADKAMDRTENAVKKVVVQDQSGSPAPEPNGPSASAAANPPQAASSYNKNYDFVPGDRIIFQPDMRAEADAELPARFTVVRGTAEIQTYEDEKILHLQPDAKTTVEPLMDSARYLPAQFTLEFDLLFENDRDYFAYASDFVVGFGRKTDRDYYYKGLYSLVIHGTSKGSFGLSGTQSYPEGLQAAFTGNTWHHVAVYVHDHIGKAYIDGYRVHATNTLPVGAESLYIRADRYGVKMKNIRLAAGGEDQYHKLMTDGKLVTHGILFDVNQSTIKPQSMGTLNTIAKLLQDHSDLNLEIDGYTDSDGSDENNARLSQARAEAVKAQLVSMGIAEARLSAKGYGESNPVDTNDTAEGKANNRRVEFVKK